MALKIGVQGIEPQYTKQFSVSMTRELVESLIQEHLEKEYPDQMDGFVQFDWLSVDENPMDSLLSRRALCVVTARQVLSLDGKRIDPTRAERQAQADRKAIEMLEQELADPKHDPDVFNLGLRGTF